MKLPSVISTCMAAVRCASPGRGGEGRREEEAHGSSTSFLSKADVWLWKSSFQMTVCLLDLNCQTQNINFQFPANCPHLINSRIHLEQKYVWEGDTVFRCPDWTCKTRICKTRTCRTRFCKRRSCKTRTCKTVICKTRT